MKIVISKNSVSGNTPVPAGDYWASLNPEAGEITLSAKGQDIRIKATRRKAPNPRTRVTSIQFYSGGGSTWSLVVNAPKQGEWVAFIEMSS